jgi:hypothetical protein
MFLPIYHWASKRFSGQDHLAERRREETVGIGFYQFPMMEFVEAIEAQRHMANESNNTRDYTYVGHHFSKG